MGEISRARDAVHQATSMEARDLALDQFWAVARESALDELHEDLEDILRQINDIEVASIIIRWIQDRLLYAKT